MGWGKTLLLDEAGECDSIEKCEKDLERLKATVSRGLNRDVSQDCQLEQLSRENGELKLYLAGLTRLLLAKQVFSSDELATIVNAIDAEDGRVDGQFKGDLLY